MCPHREHGFGGVDRVFVVDRRRDGFGIGPVAACGMPFASFASGEWVGAVVSDDVETVVSFNDVCHRHLIPCDLFGTNPKVISHPLLALGDSCSG